MAVEPQPCPPGGGGEPVEVTTCCAPSIASAPLCLADGTTVLAVVRSGCVECGQEAEDPAVVGWLDTAGTFTPGALPPDAGPCDAGCVDTVCRTLCDDTDGDGTANATYSELWCIRADGSATLVLTYQDDPSVPYTPTAPVDCTYGCPDPETVTLCDDNGPFLRRYTWLNGTATFEDFALDGQTAHVVTGTIGACTPESDCLDTVCRTRCDDTNGDGQADATYSELWCVHADGTATLVLTYQDDPSVPYMPTAPVDCEYEAVTSEALTLCDDTGPFLRRYTWTGGAATFEDTDLDGSTPHVVTGAVGLCPAVMECEAQTTPAATLGLCLANGTPIAVVVTRDCDGTVTQDGWLNLTTGAWSAGEPPAGTMACGDSRSITVSGTFCDVDPDTGDVLGLVLVEYSYAADGSIASVRLVDAVTGTTYTPQGEVTTCPAGVEQPERDLVQLCDTATDGTVTAFVRDYARDENGQITGHTDYLLDGAPYAPAGTVGVCPAESACRDCTTHILCDTDANPPAAIAGSAASGTLPNGVTWTSTGPSALPPSQQGDGAAWWGVALFPNPSIPLNTWTFDQPVNVEFSVLMVWSPGTGAGENTVQLPAGAVPVSLPPGYTYDRATNVLRADTTLTGCTLNTPTREASARFRVTGVSSLALKYLGTRAVNAECRRFGHWLFGALDVSLGGEFLRTVCRDCTGQVVSSTDTLLDGTTPYTPVGLVGVCQPPPAEAEPCRNSSSTLLCDTAAMDAVTVFDPATRPGADGWQVVSFTGANPGYPPEAALPYDAPHPPGAFMGARTDLFAGPGVAWPGYDAAPHRWVLRKTFTAPEDGIASVASVGFRGDGGARVRVNGQDAGMYGQWNQPATSGTAQIPVTAGPNIVEIEVRDGGGANWVQGRLDIVMTRTVQFMRRTVVDCETGETVSVVDTTLDGEPYEVTGTVGQCEPVAECCEPAPPEQRVDVETGELCLVDASGDILGRVLVERIYDDQSGERIAQRYVDPVTGAPVDVPAGASVAVCPAEPCRDTYTTMVCDLPVGDPAGAPTATDTSATPYPWDADPIRCINAHPGGGQALWDGGTVTIPARSSGAGSCTPNQWLAGLAARLQTDRPSCDSGTVTITVAVAARNNGPSATAANYAGSIRLHRTDTGARLAESSNLTLVSMPANTARTMTVTAVNVPAALLAAGQIVAVLDVEAWDQTGNTGAAWLLSNFTASYEFQQDGCETQFLRKIVTDCETGETVSVTDTTLDGQPYTVAGQVGQCTPASSGGECCPPPPPEPRVDVEAGELCLVDGSGDVIGRVLAERVYDDQTGERVGQRLVDPVTGDPVEVPAGASLAVCPTAEPEPCRDSSSLMVCDLPVGGDAVPAAADVTSSAVPPPIAQVDLQPHPGGGAALWSGGTVTLGPDVTTGSGIQRYRYVAAALTAPRPSCDDGTVRVAVSVDAERLGPDGGCANAGRLTLVVGGTVVAQQWVVDPQVGVTYPLRVEADVPAADLALGLVGVALALETYQLPAASCGGVARSGAWEVSGFTAAATFAQETCPQQVLSTVVTDCETGAVVSVTYTTMDGDPYTPTGEIGQCAAAGGGGGCCPPEPRVDVETLLFCVRDQASGDILGQVIAERVYDDQSGGLVEQRLTTLDGEPFTLPAGAELTKCPSPDRIIRQVCVVESGASEFLTNAANATSGQDTDWRWAPNLSGVWYPMYRVARNAAWTVTDSAPNKANWVAPHQSRSVCSPNPAQAPHVPGTWYTRASWNLPADADPDSIRIAATIMNGDNGAIQWRLNNGPWQPIASGALGGAPWTFPPTAVPGGRAGQNEIVVQQYEQQPGVTCPSLNEGGMILHVIATYDHAPKVWTQVIEPGGQVYYLDENGDRQDSIPAGRRLVPCGSGGDAPCCPAVNTDTLTLCDTAADGTVTTFLRHLTYTEGATVPGVTDTELDGVTPYTVTGTVGVCSPEAEPCRNSSTLLLCDLPTDGDPVPTVTDTPGAPYYPYTTGVAMAGAQTLWDGGTLTLPDAAGPQPGTGGTVRTAAAVIQAPRPACDAGTAHVTVQVDVTQLGPDDGCRVTGFLGLYNGPGEANRVAIALAPPDTPVGWAGTLTVEADVPAADLAAGNIAVLLAFDAYDDSGAACPTPRRTGWQLSQFDATVAYDQTGCDTQFLRTVTVDCETGAVTAVVDTTMDGQPYTLTGEPGQCSAAGGGSCCPEQPCGDTEVAQLCDLTYDPQAPIPTPAGDFTLTGNVLVGNEGTTLWFAQANQPANGVAELTVSGLLPATLYEFRFASAWIGAGAPDPANNNAIYLLEVLDGATVLASRTRNVSNGSNVFPGGVLTEDLPPLAFIAPATGAVTIRFTDQTTGGAINDRDLFLMPFEVRTAVLTVTRTPFLRRFTFDCDGGLTSTQDLGLDGATPYEVQGVVGTCGGDGSGGAATPPGPDVEVIELCDVAADGASTAFLRHLTYEAGADTPTVTDTALDGVTPYTPAGTVGICQGAAEGRDVELTPMCVVDNASGAVIQRILAEVTYDTVTGDRLSVRYVDPLTWGPVALPGGTHLDVCPEEQPDPAPDVEVVQLCDLVDGQEPVPFLRHLTYLPGATTPTVLDTALDGVTPYALTGTAGVCSTPCDVQAVLEQCRCDDTDADGLPDVGYVELLAVDCDGNLTSLGTFTDGLTGPYTPVSPVDCNAADEEEEGAPPAMGVQARRVELAAGTSWSAAAWPTLQSVTAVAFGGSGTVTTADGASTLHAGEAATWSVGRDSDALLTGPLIVTAGTGTVTLSYTIGVTLS